MPATPLAQIRECVARGNRTAALSALRTAIESDQINPHDGVELLLVMRQGTPENFRSAVEAIEHGLPGAYRFVGKADHAFA